MARHEQGLLSVRNVLVAALAFTVSTLLVTVTPARAATFTNSATITLPDPNCTDPDAASPYPSVINVSTTGTVTDVNVRLNNVNHTYQEDIDAMVVSPAGQNLVLVSDAGNGLASASNVTITFDDSAAADIPQTQWGAPGSSVTYRPEDYDPSAAVDTFPSPAPAPSAATTLATFNGANPNGDWKLYVTDDACDTGGSIAGGWTLEITTASLTATTTSVTSSLNPSRTGQNVTFTATVGSAGGPVTSGTVTFTEGGTTLAANVAVNGSGQATFSTSGLAEGNHIITATYNGTASFATSNGQVDQRVDNNTIQTGNQYCNTGAITIPASGNATPYPSNIFVTGGPTAVDKLIVQLKNVTHAFTDDLDLLLVGPGGQNLVLASDAGNGTNATSNVTVTFDDAAASDLPFGAWGAANTSVTVRPEDYDPGGAADAFPAPAPAPSAATTLGTFTGSAANGTWSLYVVDDAAPDSGSIAGGWCLTFLDVTAPSASIDLATGQPDPDSSAPINFKVTFSESVTGFTSSDVTVSGTAGGTKVATVTGGPALYNVAVTGMTTGGTVVVNFGAGAATDSSANSSTAPSIIDNTVNWVTDATAPVCAILDIITGPPKQMRVTVQDTGSGLASINVTLTENAVVTTDPSPIPSATTSQVIVTATKQDQSLPARFGFNAVDVAGNVKTCA